jgi:uncharacterized Zn finger protein
VTDVPEPPARASEGPDDGPGSTETPTAPRVHAATLPCENCGKSTVHRILRWDPRSFPKGARTSGVARCRTCGWTHPFDLPVRSELSVTTIVSKRSTSEKVQLQFPPSASLSVGDLVAGSEPPLRVRRIDLRSGGPSSQARASEVATLWAVVDEGPSIPVSILEGARTRAVRWHPDPDQSVDVGDEVRVDSLRLEVVALRAAGRTWHFPGARFRVTEVQRVYARRNAIPPAGSRDWRTVRETPSSRVISFSRSSRSRSGPGEIRKRTAPHRRTAAGGATHHSVSPS